HAVAHLGGGLGDVLGVQAAIDGPPRRAAVVGAERARRRDRDIDALGVPRIEQDRVQAHAARARLPPGPGAVAAPPGQLLPRRASAGRLPRVAAVARALDHLAEPSAGLRRIDAIGIGGGSLHVIDLPAREVRAAHVPAATLAVRRQHERALARADQYPYTTHGLLLVKLVMLSRDPSVEPQACAVT